jgi:hypothetical protein
MTTRTHFAFRIDMWSPDGSSIIEPIAGVEDFQLHKRLTGLPSSVGPAAQSHDFGRNSTPGFGRGFSCPSPMAFFPMVAILSPARLAVGSGFRKAPCGGIAATQLGSRSRAPTTATANRRVGGELRRKRTGARRNGDDRRPASRRLHFRYRNHHRRSHCIPCEMVARVIRTSAPAAHP